MQLVAFGRKQINCYLCNLWPLEEFDLCNWWPLGEHSKALHWLLNHQVYENYSCVSKWWKFTPWGSDMSVCKAHLSVSAQC